MKKKQRKRMERRIIKKVATIMMGHAEVKFAEVTRGIEKAADKAEAAIINSGSGVVMLTPEGPVVMTKDKPPNWPEELPEK